MDEFKGCKNYTLIGEEWLEDIGSKAYVLKHDKTGARVCLLNNDDDNKVFVIGFRTIPDDSTGVAHILEHSVLCGSEKYPVKDAMTEVGKGSLNTFMNAFTYADRTLYPVASLNEKDFNNLMKVYLDAVFRPRVYEEPRTFLQEGWHYELEDKDSDIIINGVVYNEMKGVYSSPADVNGRNTFSSLFPDTQYGVDSGGDPKHIPDLSYDTFIKFHKRMYHPSNARIYIYGNTDFEEKLRYIDEEYLSRYEKIDPKTEIKLQAPFESPKYITKEYSITDSETGKDAAFLNYNVCCANFDETEIIDAMNVINYALVSVPGAKLKERLLNAGIGKDVYSELSTDAGQKQFSIIAENANAEDEERFVEIIEDTIKEIIKEGFDKKTLLAAITSQEFSYREADFGYYPRGLIYGMNVFEIWNYTDDNIFNALKQNAVFKELKDKMESGFFEKVLKERILENNHKTVLKTVPKKGLSVKEDERLSKKLKKLKESLSDEQIDKLIDDTKALKIFQEETDSEEALSTIPTLTKDDIPLKGRRVDYKTVRKDGITYVENTQFTNNIAYVTLSFTLDTLPKHLLKAVSVIKLLMTQLDTENYAYKDLINEIGIIAGGMNVSSAVYRNVYDSDVFDAALEGRFKTLTENIVPSIRLMLEILFSTKFDDRKRIKDVLEENRTRIKEYLISSGHSVAYSSLNSYSSKAGFVAEQLSGMGQFRTIDDLCNNFDEKIDPFIKDIKEALSYIFTKENLTVAVSADKEGIERFENAFSDFLKNIPSKKTDSVSYNIDLGKKQEAFTSASQVQYVALGGNFRKHGLEYTGSLSVLRNILSTDYLWTAVRLKGGAYGVMCAFTRTGESVMVSYRDPNLEKTLKAYEGAYDYIAAYPDDDDLTERFIISSIGDVDTPYTPSLTAQMAFAMYKSGLTNEIVDKERKEILSTTPETIRDLKKYIKVLIDENALVCVGGEAAINKASKLFDHIEPLF